MRLSLLLLLLALSSVSALAEDSAGCSTLQKQLVDHPRFLRDYSAEGVREYEMQAGALKSSEAKLREFSAFTAEKVKCYGTTVTLEGKRRFVILDSVSHSLIQTNVTAQAKIVVKVKDTSMEEASSTLADLLFWPTGKDAVSSVPDYMANMVPATYDVNSKAYVDCVTCGTGMAYPESATLNTMSKASGVQPPRLTKQIDPEFTEEARQMKDRHGESRVAMIVEADGKPSHIWITRSLEFGLDENAAKAVSQYRFSPARKDGLPIPVVLNVAVNFTIFPGQ